MLNTLSGRFLILTVAFVMLAEVLIFVPSVARFREDYLLLRAEKAQIASLARLADDNVDEDLQEELLRNAGVFNVVLRRDDARQLVLTAPLPQPISETFDLRDPGSLVLIHDALFRLFNPKPEVIRVIAEPVQGSGLMIEITLETAPMRQAMIGYGLRILMLSAGISMFTAVLLFLAVRTMLVQPIKRVVGNMRAYADAPEDARRMIKPGNGVRELRQAEEALSEMQTQLTLALKQKDRLAQLGAAVAKISHDLRNILTSAQLFTDRIEESEDPAVRRLAPKLVNSITRAVNLCETSLAFGRAEEPAPRITRVRLLDVVADVLDGERLATGEADISFSEDIPGDLVLRADAEQLYRVLQNLVRNARQAITSSRRPGEICVQAEETETDWIIDVIDNGPGLPAKARDNLFTAFHGGASKGGSGLGLSIAAELISNHGGALELAKTSDTGTTFRIKLPRKDFFEG